MIEIPPRFAHQSPVNPAATEDQTVVAGKWSGTQGLAEDIRFYGNWMRDEAERRIGHLYPKVEITAEIVRERPDMEPYERRSLTVVAWLWARTVKSPHPAFADVDVPLISSFMVSTRKGREAFVEPVIEARGYRFTVKTGKPANSDAARGGTRLSSRAFRCLLSDAPIPYEYIDDEANSGRMKERLMAVVVAGDRTRIYLPPTSEAEAVARRAEPGLEAGYTKPWNLGKQRPGTTLRVRDVRGLLHSAPACCIDYVLRPGGGSNCARSARRDQCRTMQRRTATARRRSGGNGIRGSGRRLSGVCGVTIG